MKKWSCVPNVQVVGLLAALRLFLEFDLSLLELTLPKIYNIWYTNLVNRDREWWVSVKGAFA